MSFLSFLFGDTANAERAAAADAELRALNEARAAELGPEWKAEVDHNYGTQVTFDPKEQDKQVNTAFGEGWNEGKANVTGVVSGFFKVIRDVVSSVILGIPFWVWAAALIGIWVWLGTPGLKTLKKKLPA